MTTNRCLDPACADGPSQDDQPMPRFCDGDSNLCRRCGDLLERRLAEIPSHQENLRAVLGGLRSTARGENRPTKGTPPVPLNIAAHDHLTAMHATVVSWVRMTAEERGLRGPDRNDLAPLSAWLLSQLPWLLEHGAVGDFADEMRDLTRVAEGLSQVSRKPTRAGVDCFSCSSPLVRPVVDGMEEDRYTCTGCGREYEDGQYLMALKHAAWEASRVVIDDEVWATPESLSHDLSRSLNSLKAWRRNKLVRVRDISGVAFFHVGDVEREHAARATRRIDMHRAAS